MISRMPSVLKLHTGDIFGDGLSCAISLRCTIGEKGSWYNLAIETGIWVLSSWETSWKCLLSFSFVLKLCVSVGP